MAHCCEHNCIEELTADHQKILAKVDELEKKNNVKEFLEFTESFAEPHHRKEEKVLFPDLEKKGIPREGGPIGVMLSEHEAKRGLVKELRRLMEEPAFVKTTAGKAKIKENALAIVSLLRDHIFKEDNILYPCAKDALSEEEMAELGHQCEKIKA